MLTSRFCSLRSVIIVDVARLLAEAADDPDAAERLLQVGGDGGDPLAGRPVGAGGDDPEDDAGDRQQREGEEGDQGQLDVEQEQDHDHADQGQGAGEDRHDAVGDELVERLDVVGHPRDQDAGAAAGEEADRHRLEVGEEPLAQVLQGAGADPADQVGLGVGADRVDDRDGDEGGDDQVEGAEVAGLDPGVDRPAGQVGRRQAGAGLDQQRDEHQRHPAAVGPQQADHPAHLAPALVLAADQAPERPEEQEDVAQPVAPARRRARLAHSRAISSRSSRSRCRKTESARPCSAISR